VTPPLPASAPTLIAGRYLACSVLGAGGMGTVSLGVALGPLGIVRLVAIKSPHAQLTSSMEFRSAFADEARIASRVHHPNVVEVIDVVAEGPEIAIVMEYVRGPSLAKLLERLRSDGRKMPVHIAVAIACDVLRGLDAAHAACGVDGEPLGIVHRDVSHANVIVGADGLSRVLDFGVAKALGRAQVTDDGRLKGKIAFMGPERLRGLAASRQSDVYSLGVVLWETLAGRALFAGASDAETVARVCEGIVPALSSIRDDEPEAIRKLDAVLRVALASDPGARYGRTTEMLDELVRAMRPATHDEVARWLRATVEDLLQERAAMEADAESAASEVEPRANPSASASPPPMAPNPGAVSSLDSNRVRSPRTLAISASAAGAAVVVAALVALVTSNESANASKHPPSAVRSAFIAVESLSVPEVTRAAVHSPSSSAVAVHVRPPGPGLDRRDCDPPYEVRDGVKVFKKRCMR
jgi:serine/threonine protein kinase